MISRLAVGKPGTMRARRIVSSPATLSEFLSAAALMALFAGLLAAIWLVKTNVPMLDDYDAVLAFRGRWSDASGLLASLVELLAAHNGHRIVTTRAVVLLDEACFGDIDFRRLSTYAAAGLPVLAWAITRTVRHEQGGPWRGWATLCVWALVLRPEHWKYLLYPMADIQAVWATAFGLVALSAFTRETPRSAVLSGLAVVAALLTNSSALVLVPLVLLGALVRRRFRMLAVCAVLGIFVVWLYTRGAGAKAGLLAGVLEDPWPRIRFALGVLGASATSFLPRGAYASVAAGCVVLGSCVWVWARSVPGEQLGLKLMLAYVAGSSLLVGLARAAKYEQNWAEMVLDGRYRVYSVVAFAILFVVVARKVVMARATLRPAFVAVALLLHAASYRAYLPEWRSKMRWGHEVAMAYVVRGDASKLPPRRKAKKSLDRALSEGYYQPPAERYEDASGFGARAKVQ